MAQPGAQRAGAFGPGQRRVAQHRGAGQQCRVQAQTGDPDLQHLQDAPAHPGGLRGLREDPVEVVACAHHDAVTAHRASAGAHQTVFDAVAADPTDAGLLEVGEGAPLLRERRVTTDSAGTPLECSEDRYRPDVASVTVTNTRSRRADVTRSGPAWAGEFTPSAAAEVARS